MIRTLALLVASMTLGTLALRMLETPPARPAVVVDLRAVENDSARPELAMLRQTDVPLQFIKWRNVVVHDAGRDGPAAAEGCHFLIGGADGFGDGAIRPTRRWRQQLDGRHILVPGFDFNANSVGVCLLCDTRRQRPTRRQLGALVRLVRALQLTCSISPDHVYLHSELGEPGCPGEGFPAESFRGRLLPAPR